jgi:hypothetical protein
LALEAAAGFVVAGATLAVALVALIFFFGGAVSLVSFVEEGESERFLAAVRLAWVSTVAAATRADRRGGGMFGKLFVVHSLPHVSESMNCSDNGFETTTTMGGRGNGQKLWKHICYYLRRPQKLVREIFGCRVHWSKDSGDGYSVGLAFLES